MEHAKLGQTKRLFIAGAAAALAGCTGSGSPERDLADSAALVVPGAPAPAAQPAGAESVTRAPSRAPDAGSTPAGRQTPARSDTLLKPPPPHDTRPSIPWPQDTLTLRRDTT